MVQVKSSNGSVRVLNDDDPEVLYEGPLVVLVNAFSASASEIVAAALRGPERLSEAVNRGLGRRPRLQVAGGGHQVGMVAAQVDSLDPQRAAAFDHLQALRAVRKHKPSVVLGAGGFASGPGGVAAWLLRRPLVVHEQNPAVSTTILLQQQS